MVEYENFLDPYFLYKMGQIKPKKHFTLLSLFIKISLAALLLFSCGLIFYLPPTPSSLSQFFSFVVPLYGIVCSIYSCLLNLQFVFSFINCLWHIQRPLFPFIKGIEKEKNRGKSMTADKTEPCIHSDPLFQSVLLFQLFWHWSRWQAKLPVLRIRINFLTFHESETLAYRPSTRASLYGLTCEPPKPQRKSPWLHFEPPQHQVFTLMQTGSGISFLMRTPIRLFTLMQIRIWLPKMMRIHLDPDPDMQHMTLLHAS